MFDATHCAPPPCRLPRRPGAQLCLWSLPVSDPRSSCRVPGYGSVSPRTTWGRLVSISYAIIGIPLMLLYLSTTGESLARSFRRAYSRMCVRYASSDKMKRRDPGEKASSKLKQGGKTGKQGANKSATGKAGGGGKLGKAGGGKGKGPAVITGSSGKPPAATSSMKAHQAASQHNHLGMSLGAALGATDELTLKVDRALAVVDCGGGDGVGLSGNGAASSSEPGPAPPPLGSVKVPVLLCLLVLLAYIAAGAFLFHYLEGWSLVEGSYFCFTTLGTIGFGDLIPGRASGRVRGPRAEVVSVLSASVYILVGMALVAMTFALVQDEFVGVLRRLSRQCSAASPTAAAGAQPGGHASHSSRPPRPRPSCSDSESNTDPPGGSLSVCGGGGEAMAMTPGAPCAAKPPLGPLGPGGPLGPLGPPAGACGGPLPPRMAHSLPRRKASVPADEFGRNGPGRRSAGPGGSSGASGRLSPEPLMEYFVPRSVSEFNLAGVVAEEDEVPEPPGPPKIPMPPGPPGLHPGPHHLTAILRAPSGPSRRLGMASSRSREKMVTFEDDAPGLPVPPGPGPGPCSPCSGPCQGDMFM
ncbi:Potassium channel subfamily K member 10 [Frankliniella fusca]|uniref:Potassium channel subfamily K member 10 n=1 Tax=Frankliniella fusca TaxID=407009 RepID=A0AAE1HTE1_9NEOP|nr:Potassium channel subfamily K member 10 [Frankliniella fusca]